MTAPRRALVSVDEVVDRLANDILRLCQQLLPGGRMKGHEWMCGSLAGEAGDHLGVHLDGTKAGVWKDFRADIAGDAFDLVAQVLFRGDKKCAFAWSLDWLGLAKATPEQLAEQRREVEVRSATRSAEAEAEAERSRKAGRRLWLSATEKLLGTPVEYYLAGRGIDVAALLETPHALGALRYGSSVWNEDAQARMPAMLAAIGAPGVGFLSCHRTYLARAGHGDWRKAPVDKPKKVTNSYAGGCISLWRGATGRAFPKAQPGEIVDVTEGIEDGLSVATSAPECRVIAAVSLSNLRGLVLPEGVKHLRIWKQNDTHPAAIAAFDRAVNALLERGLTLSIAAVPEGVKDVNELLTKDQG